MSTRLLVGGILVLLVVMGVFVWYLTGRESGKVGEVTQTPTIIAGGRQIVLLGSGATFIYPQLDAWAKEFSKRYSNVRIEYNPTGSGTGQRQFIEK
ncbi:MAG: substrate-binding domain-containing protein, partial [Acidilobaceae archaeon]